MITFKNFLLEGGNATAKYGTSRANKKDIEDILRKVGISLKLDLTERLLGSTNLTLAGKKKDSGDIDIAITSDDNVNMEEAHEKMMELANNEGSLNKGTNVGSYAIPINDKKVQVDLMFVNSGDWARFIYHSAEGDKSAYPGVVRNFLLMAAVRYTLEPGKDVIVKKDDQVVARASRALKLDTGLERLFKMANQKNGKFGKGMNKVEPVQLQKQIDQLAGKPVKFSHDAEIINDPNEVAQFLFGKGVTAKDLMTAEDVIKHIKKLPNADEVIAAVKKDLEKSSLPIPKEL